MSSISDNSTPITHCPICGADTLEQPFESAIAVLVSFEICDCCGCQYGYDDDEKYYHNWLSNGSKWFEPEMKPTDWSLDQQIKYQIRPWPPK